MTIESTIGWASATKSSGGVPAKLSIEKTIGRPSDVEDQIESRRPERTPLPSAREEWDRR